MLAEQARQVESFGGVSGGAQMEIEDREAILVERDEGARFLLGFGAVDCEPFSSKILPEREADTRLIIDHEDSNHHDFPLRKGRADRQSLVNY